MISRLYLFFDGLDVPGVSTELMFYSTCVVGIILLSVFAGWIAKAWILRGLRSLVKKTKFKWDDVLVENRVLGRISHLAPALVVDYLAEPCFGQLIAEDGQPLQPESWLLGVSETFVSLYLVVIILMIFDAVLNAVGKSVEGRALAKRLPLRGITQALKLVANCVGIVYIISFCFGKSPVAVLSGLGAMTAVLMLIFKDSLLGLVAGFQLSLNNMIVKGDWIEMAKHGVDGEVLDVNLNTVRVQNWDKTITAIPTYDLVTGSFKNWRGMSESGGRRIKRSIHIDMRSVRFVDEEQMKKFLSIRILQPYLHRKLSELDTHNGSEKGDLQVLANGRRLTNLGTFRAYCVAYLQSNPEIHKVGMTFLVRQLPPGPDGIGIELYVFTKTTQWVAYEDIQADLFDHLLAILPEFGLAPFQNLTGQDIAGAFGGQSK
jgi:miniconductance mechanosensitive channel